MARSIWTVAFGKLLIRLGEDSLLGNRRFVPRNFRLERRLAPSRVSVYESDVNSVSDYLTLKRHHDRYLARFILRPAPPRGIQRIIEPVDAPLTFTIDPLVQRFGGSADDLFLVRMMPLRTLARLGDRSVAETRDALRSPTLVADLLADVNERLRLQPTFAGFWEDVEDLTPEDAASAPATWADRLRDAFGMSLLLPPPGGVIPIVVLRYAVDEIPRIRGLRGAHPLVQPTVLDAELFEAFCPPPVGAPVGCLVNLAGDLGRDPAGEILHPTVPLTPDHVFREGDVRRVPEPLERARAAHITMMQDRFDSAFATDTDSDILATY